MTKILVTQGERAWGTYLSANPGGAPTFEILEMVFPDARTITRDNKGWSVELELPR